MEKNLEFVVADLKSEGYSNLAISRVTGISPSAISTFCIRNSIEPLVQKTKEENNRLKRCGRCGKPIIQKTDKAKEYCSSYCRRQAWRERNRATAKKDENPKNSAGLIEPKERLIE